ncbi:armadillo-type protein [Collybia nuda]|uniref:Armadillo-type protein n=1 Tax=Collybia nuda TaxID=64659 RepID=A0A9P5XVY6_9AGAR|nr:armadillo-type protein [Collybia nuda]
MSQMHPESEGDKYAMNENNAERGNNHPAGPSAAPRTIGVGGRDLDDTECDKLRPDAKIWSLYLTKAEEKARQQAELWKTGLESLLIFAGLFAGVVASFVVESRRDLQPQTKAEILLANILNAVRNETSSQDMFTPSASARWINGLWFVSLLITLFSAIMGVLAKSWIVKFIPVASGQESDDAYRRWVYDERAKLWYLEKGITTIPLLIQTALLLFCFGFTLQSIGDDPSLGWVVLVLVVLGIIIYIIITALPLFYPWIPIQTPLSDVLAGIVHFYRSIPPSGLSTLTSKYSHINRSRREVPNKDNVLLEIWRSQLTQAARPTNVDEAIAELNRIKLSDTWWKRFVGWDTPKILCSRLRESITYGLQHEFAYDVLCDHLYALSGLAEHFESSDPDRLITELGPFLKTGNPLNRWNVFPEPVRALAFGVRVPILLAHKEDFTTREMEERPWETMVHDMSPNHRFKFVMAACRGLAGDQGRLRKISALSIIVSIAKATTAAVGPKSEWVVEVSTEAKTETERLARQYLEKLFREIAMGWKQIIFENSSKTPSTTANSDPWNMIIPGNPSLALKPSNAEVHRQITMLGMLAEDADFDQFVKISIPKLARISVDNPNGDIRNHGITELISLAQNERLHDAVKETLLESLGSALQSFYSRTRIHAIEALVLLVRHSDPQSHFQDIVSSLIRRFFGMLVNNYNKDVRDAAMNAFPSFFLNENLRNIIMLIVPESVISLFGSSHWQLRLHAVETLLTLIQRFNFPDIVNPTLPKLVDLTLSDEDGNVCAAGMKTLGSVAQNSVLRDNAIPMLPRILHFAWDRVDSSARTSWIEILIILVRKVDYRDSIKAAMPTLFIIMLNDADAGVYAAGMKAITSLAEDEFLRDTIVPEYLQGLYSALTNSPWKVHKIRAIDTLVELAKDSHFRNSIKEALPGLVELMMNDPDNAVRTAGARPLALLIKSDDMIKKSVPEILESRFKNGSPKNRIHIIDAIGDISEFRDAAQSAIPRVVDMAVYDTNHHVRIAGIKAIARLAHDDDLRRIVRPTVSDILSSAWRDPNWQVRSAWAVMLATLSQNLNFPRLIESAIPTLIRIARNDSNKNVCVAGIKSIALLAKYRNYQSIIKEDLIKIIQTALGDRSWEIRIAWAEIHIILAHNNDLQNYIESDVPKLLKMSTHDADKDVRIASIKTLVSLAQDDKPQSIHRVARDSIKSALIKNLDLPFKDSHWQVRITWVEALETVIVRVSNFRDNVRLILIKLVELAVKDEGPDVRGAAVNALISLTNNDDGIREAIIPTLPKNLDSVFKDFRLRADWSQILYTLAQYSPRRMGGAAKSAIPRIVKLAVKDDDDNIRTINMNLLTSLMKEGVLTLPSCSAGPWAPNIIGSFPASFRDAGKPALSKNLDLALKESDWQLRIRALESLGILVPKSEFQDVVKSTIPQILKMAVNDEEKDVRTAGMNILEKLRAEKNGIGDAILLAIPSAIALITPEGWGIQNAIDNLLNFTRLPEHPGYMTRVLTARLKESLWLTRATALELLTSLNRYTTLKQYVQSVIPEIITLALEDKEDGVRAAGIRSLAKLAEEDALQDRIKLVLPQLMSLIEVGNLRTPVVELISLLSVDENGSSFN